MRARLSFLAATRLDAWVEIREDTMNNIFFDCEFTKLPSSLEGYPGLISIGCKAEDGRQSFYAELTDTWQLGNCSDFVLKNVVPLLGDSRSQMTEADCASRLRNWIEALPGEVTMRSDNPSIDWPWTEHLFQFFGCWPKNLRRKCGAIAFESEGQQEIFDVALLKYWAEPFNAMHRHHALFDANSLVFSWWYANALIMSDSHFSDLVSNLNKNGVEDGDIGYRYWTDIADDLKDMRMNFALHKEAIQRMQIAPACLDDVLNKLAEWINQNPSPDIKEWQRILHECDWAAALAISDQANELRKRSPCLVALTEDERLRIIGKYRRIVTLDRNGKYKRYG
jgi:hypothetical protein